jgi:hypothetical protein
MLVELQAALAKLDAGTGRSPEQMQSLEETRQKVKQALADLEEKRTLKEKQFTDANLEQLAELKSKIVEANRKQDEMSAEDAKLMKQYLSEQISKKQAIEMSRDWEASQKASSADMEKQWVAQQKDIEAKFKLALAYKTEGQLELDRATVEQLSPVLKAEPGNVSVVGAVNHAGPFKWESGMTAGQAIEHAGLRGDRSGLDFVIVRSINFSADGSGRWVGHVSFERVDWSAPLHEGDVIVVTKKTDGEAKDGGVN